MYAMRECVCVCVCMHVRMRKGVRLEERGEGRREKESVMHSVTQSSLERPAEMGKWIHA